MNTIFFFFFPWREGQQETIFDQLFRADIHNKKRLISDGASAPKASLFFHESCNKERGGCHRGFCVHKHKRKEVEKKKKKKSPRSPPLLSPFSIGVSVDYCHDATSTKRGQIDRPI